MQSATARQLELQPGAPVRVTCAGGRQVQNVVWRDFGDVVLVCGPEQYSRLMQGHQSPMPIGFKREDVDPMN